MKKFKAYLKRFIKLFAVWCLFVIAVAFFSWGRSYFVDFGPRPQMFEIDLRHDKTQTGENITFVATQPEPEKAWYFGHLWVWFGKDLPNEAKGKTQFGYYSQNQNIAAFELAKSVLNPMGFYFGQKAVKGELRDDGQWQHHLELRVLIDEDVYQNAIKRHEAWRAQSVYINRPKWGEKSYACQDYAFDIAKAIGLKTPSKSFGIFPPESFIKLAQLNGIKIPHKYGIKR